MVRVLALGDPHGEVPKNLDKIVSKNKPHLIICVGDYAWTPEKPWLQESWIGISKKKVDDSYRSVVNKIASYGLPVLTLRGNMLLAKDRKKTASKILRKHKNIIDKWTARLKLLEETFIFFDVIYEKHNYRSKGAWRWLKKNPSKEKRLNKLLRENKDAILIAHNPPYNLVDRAYNGRHIGSKIIRRAIEKYPPKIVFCGHIHEAKGKAMLGKTPVYNLGWHGDYAVFDIDKNVKLVESNFLK